jgi:hypothetical protein
MAGRPRSSDGVSSAVAAPGPQDAPAARRPAGERRRDRVPTPSRGWARSPCRGTRRSPVPSARRCGRRPARRPHAPARGSRRSRDGGDSGRRPRAAPARTGARVVPPHDLGSRDRGEVGGPLVLCRGHRAPGRSRRSRACRPATRRERRASGGPARTPCRGRPVRAIPSAGAHPTPWTGHSRSPGMTVQRVDGTTPRHARDNPPPRSGNGPGQPPRPPRCCRRARRCAAGPRARPPSPRSRAAASPPRDVDRDDRRVPRLESKPGAEQVARRRSCSWIASTPISSSRSSAGAAPTHENHAGLMSSRRALPANRSGGP